MDYIKIEATDLTYVLGNIDKIKEDLNELKQKQLDRVYSNKEMLSTLGVSDKLLIQYRNDVVLPYRRMDDKYWYTQEDLDYFMNTHKVGVPFAS